MRLPVRRQETALRGWDTETGLIQSGLLAPPLACITWCDALDQPIEIVHGDDPAAYRVAVETLSRPHVGANVAFDLAVLGARFRDLVPLVFESIGAWDQEESNAHDVQLRQKLIDIGEGQLRMREMEGDDGEPVYVSVGYNLSALNKRYFGDVLEKDEWRLQYGRLRHLPLVQWPAGAVDYAKLDTLSTLKIFYAQAGMQRGVVGPDGYTKIRAPIEAYLSNERFQVRAAFALQLLSCWGIKIDPHEVERFLGVLRGEQEERRERLVKTGLVRLDGSRNMKLAHAKILALVGLDGDLTPKGLEQYRAWWAQMSKLGKLTEESRRSEKMRLLSAGYISVSGDSCIKSGDEVLQEFAKYGQFQTLVSKISKLKTGGLPIQTSFDSLLDTGRTSSFSSKIISNSIALQNLPRKPGMRECFVPREDQCFVAADYGMAELVAIAQITYSLFGYSKLRDVLNAGLDPHCDLGSRILGTSYEDFYARNKAGEQSIVDYRTLCKSLNFGLIGGLGAEKFVDFSRKSYGVVLAATQDESIEKAKLYKKAWLDRWEEMQEYLAYIGRLCEDRGFCDIKQLKSNRLRGRIRFTVAANGYMQGLTADASKAALIECVRRCYVMPRSVMYGSRILLFVHDENIGETKLQNGPAFASEMQQVMEHIYSQYTPDVKIGVEATIMRERWSKKAKPVWHEGVLRPWEDRDLFKKVA